MESRKRLYTFSHVQSPCGMFAARRGPSWSGNAALACYFFFSNDTATTEIYTLSLHDALPICFDSDSQHSPAQARTNASGIVKWPLRSEEHTSELQSPMYLVCRLLLEKKK